MQRGSTKTTSVISNLVIERDKRVWDLSCEHAAFGFDLRLLSQQLNHRLITDRLCGRPILLGLLKSGSNHIESLLCTLETLHDLELLIFKGVDPPVKCDDLMLYALEILRIADVTGVHPLFVLQPPAAYLFNFAVGLLLLSTQVANLSFGLDALSVEFVDVSGQIRNHRMLGQALLTMSQLGEHRISTLQVEQNELGVRVGLQRGLLG